MPPAGQPALSELCYLDAKNVSSPAGLLSELELVTPEGKPIGSVAGVVIDAAAGRVRYLDVQSSGWLRGRRYLVEADHLAQVDAEQKVLRLLESDLTEVRGLDPAALHPFSDDDLLAALFPTRAA
ncbi:MAG TPA: PRC-barrel domain-containing protein [Vicinamibacterales bacterium]|nr:PRC-barrel domain-containing protein [Vicinamibacterales bacterium]